MGRPISSRNPTTLSSLNEYATADDFQRMFASEMVDMFRLAFLLTADAEKAEHCLILTIHQCMASKSVLKWWLPVWTRNALIQNAITDVTRGPFRPAGRMSRHQMLSMIRNSKQSAMHALDESDGILQLSEFDRLVYVLYFVEHYPTRDCSMFLGKSRQEVRDAQNRAFGQVVAFEQASRQASCESADMYPPPPREGTGVDGSCGSLLA